jgi:hemolysin III
MFPEYTRRERMADAIVHLIGLTFSTAAVILLLAVSAGRVSGLALLSLAIYGAGLITMFACSAAYNMARRRALKELLRRFDHAAIFVMIAGSYTPFALGKMGGSTGLALFAAVWAIALFGVVVKLWFPRRLERLSIGIYLAQGWLIILAVDSLVASVSQFSLVLLVTGGIIYTLGVVFHVMERLPFHNAIWHGFVLAAAICHYAAIYAATLA